MKIHSIVVLGGLGFIGSHVCRKLVLEGHPVRVFDREGAPRERIKDIEDRIEIVSGDIARAEDVLSGIADATTLIHLVHTTVPQGSMDDPAGDVIDNVASTARWASRLGRTNLKKIVYISSGGAVYGMVNKPRISESDPTNPISSYGITKLAIEKYLSMYSAMNGIACLIARPANIYGPNQRLDKAQGIIGTLAHRALRGDPVEIWGTGEVVRDYLHVGDLVAAIVSLIPYDGSERVFNVGSGIGHSVREIVDLISDDLARELNVVSKPGRRFDVPSNILDSSRLQRETGCEPRISLVDGIREVLASFRA